MLSLNPRSASVSMCILLSTDVGEGNHRESGGTSLQDMLLVLTCECCIASSNNNVISSSGVATCSEGWPVKHSRRKILLYRKFHEVYRPIFFNIKSMTPLTKFLALPLISSLIFFLYLH